MSSLRAHTTAGKAPQAALTKAPPTRAFGGVYTAKPQVLAAYGCEIDYLQV